MDTISGTAGNLGRSRRASLAAETTIRGVGLHSGSPVTLRIFPAEPGAGLVFRAGRGQVGDIPVSPYHVVDTVHAVTLGNSDRRVSTVEHLLCGLAVAGVTDAFFELEGTEIPILDGSALPFYEAIMGAGILESTVPIEPITIQSPIWVVQKDKYIIALPHPGFRVTYGIAFAHPELRGQSFSEDLDTERCRTDLLAARTFGFYKEVEQMRARGLARGASLENAVVLTDDGYMNESLRYPDECIRHKVLDLIGDLYLLGRPLRAHIIASRAGHALDVALCRNILDALASDELAARRDLALPGAGRVAH